MFAGGLAVGWALALLTGLVLGRIEDHFIEITLTTVLAYASYLFAEQVLQVSGVMATIAAGITIGGWGRMKISHSVRNYLEHFWEYIAFMANALIFLMVGLRVNLSTLRGSLGLLFWVVLALLISRATVIYGLMPLVERLPKAEPISRAYQAVIFWGGLRGAIGLAVVLSLPAFAYRDTFIALVIGAVLFTLVVQGLTIEPIVRRLGLHRPRLADGLARLEADFAAKHRAVERMPGLLSGGLFPGSLAMRLLARYEKKIDAIKTEIEELHRTELNDDDQLRMLLSDRVATEERSVYVDLFKKGQVSERSFRRLLFSLQRQVDAVRTSNEFSEAESKDSIVLRIEGAALRLAERMRFLSQFTQRLRLRLVAGDYEIAQARFQSGKRVLEILDTLARVESTPWYIVDKLRRRYQKIYKSTQHELDVIAEQFPDFINDVQSRLAERLLLMEERESIAEEIEQGALPSIVGEQMCRDIATRNRELSRQQPAKLDLEPLEFLRTIAFFQDIPMEDIANIAVRMKVENFAEGSIVLRQGEPGDHIFFISHGVVRVLRVSRSELGVERDLATLMAGDYFGEDALLRREPRNATVTAVTECTFYKLHREDLNVAMETQPGIRKALVKESRKRRAMHLAG
jgi:CPA1 family monovalent cation:H+ antiporter